MALTKTQKRDLRDNVSLGVSMGSLMVGIAGLAMMLNRKPEDDEEVLYSEKLGEVRRKRSPSPQHDENMPGIPRLCTFSSTHRETVWPSRNPLTSTCCFGFRHRCEIPQCNTSGCQGRSPIHKGFCSCGSDSGSLEEVIISPTRRRTRA